MVFLFPGVKKVAKKETPANLRARSAMRAFYSALENKLKRFQPIDYAPFASLTMRKGLEDIKMRVYFPPFKILHSIEANCAYARGQNKDPVDKSRLGAVMNVWHDNPNPLSEETIKANVQHFVLLMTREQIELQYHHSPNKTARIQRLFVTGNPMPTVSSEFEDRYGLSIEKWIQLCWLTWAACNKAESGCFLKSELHNYKEIDITDSEIESYFSLVGRTPNQIGNRFREEVLKKQPELRFLIRSIFLDTPVMDFGQDRMLVPHPQLVLRNSGQGLYKLIKPLSGFDKEFGDTVQSYAGDILKCLDGRLLLLHDKQLEDLSGQGKSCDFLVELSDCVVLVECKATTFVATGLLDHVILDDGSTGKVAEGMVQLYSTAHDLEQGTFDSVGVSRRKPVLGIVATFGEIPLANNDWYFESFILRRAEKGLKRSIYPSDSMVRRPLVLSLQTLENLVKLLNSTKASPFALYDEKDQLPYTQVGDWDSYLSNKLQKLGNRIEQLAFVEKELGGFFEKIIGRQAPVD